ncbi:hypothetical protein ABH944_005290 [Caballeronia udeis]
MIGGANGQVAQGAMLAAHHRLNTRLSKPAGRGANSTQDLHVDGFTTLSAQVLFTLSGFKKRCDTLCRHFQMRSNQSVIKLSSIRFAP